MAIDLAALKAKLAARAAAPLTGVNENETGNLVVKDNNSGLDTSVPAVSDGQGSSTSTAVTVSTVPTVSAPAVLGTAKTSEIDHLDFLAKLNKLAEAIHTAHPTMPVLLMQIHKQLRADEELVSTLDDDAIGIVVQGLQLQTKTELVSVVLRESKSKAKKIAVTTDMF